MLPRTCNDWRRVQLGRLSSKMDQMLLKLKELGGGDGFGYLEKKKKQRKKKKINAQFKHWRTAWQWTLGQDGDEIFLQVAEGKVNGEMGFWWAKQTDKEKNPRTHRRWIWVMLSKACGSIQVIRLSWSWLWWEVWNGKKCEQLHGVNWKAKEIEILTVWEGCQDQWMTGPKFV